MVKHKETLENERSKMNKLSIRIKRYERVDLVDVILDMLLLGLLMHIVYLDMVTLI